MRHLVPLSLIIWISLITKDHLPTMHYEFQQLAYWLAGLWLNLTASLITSFFICILPDTFFFLNIADILFRVFFTLSLWSLDEVREFPGDYPSRS